MSERRIAISGAGIGGLTTALALARVGFRVTIAERATALSDAGAGVQIAPNAGRVLAELGLESAIADRATEPEAIVVRSGMHGGILAAIPAAAFRRRYGLPYRVMHRAELQAALVEAVTADPAISLKLGADRVGVAEPADALIAADGVWSSHREGIPGASRAVASGRTAWRATVPAAALPDVARQNSVQLWLGRGAHLAHYPMAEGASVNIVAIVEENWQGEGWSAPGDPVEFAARFAGWSGDVRAIVDAPPAWQKFAIATVDPNAPWTDGTTALLGDAAHAMLPFLAQGAAMAIEDAAVLASCLAGTPDIASGLRAYETARKPRVARVAGASRRTGDWYHAGGAAALVRDVALRIGGATLLLGMNDWIYGWRPRGPRLMTPMRRSSQ